MASNCWQTNTAEIQARLCLQQFGSYFHRRGGFEADFVHCLPRIGSPTSKIELGLNIHTWISNTKEWMILPKYWHLYNNLCRKSMPRVLFDLPRIGILFRLIGGKLLSLCRIILIFQPTLFWFFSLNKSEKFGLSLFNFYDKEICRYRRPRGLDDQWTLGELYLSFLRSLCFEKKVAGAELDILICGSHYLIRFHLKAGFIK